MPGPARPPREIQAIDAGVAGGAGSSRPASDLLLFCPSSFGGIADYAHHQAEAIGKLGWQVTMLCPGNYPHVASNYHQVRILPYVRKRSMVRISRVLRTARDMLRSYSMLADHVRREGTRHVLLASYSEYLAPLWAPRLRRLAKAGVVFGAVAHDPVRDFIVGPTWWHRFSVGEGYSFLSHVFVHDEIELETGAGGFRPATTIVPHGLYDFPDPTRAREEIRNEFGIPTDAPLFLSFGHLRNGKNLNLILEAMTAVPEAWLLVVGTEAGTGHMRSEDYKRQAESLGVADRCQWRIGFASPEIAADCFHASDYVLLTYDQRFRSASGVLNVAARYRKPVVASCGESNLCSVVRNYKLGPRVGPDREDEIARGMREVLSSRPEAQWERYAEENSWKTNAERIVKTYRNSRE